MDMTTELTKRRVTMAAGTTAILLLGALWVACGGGGGATPSVSTTGTATVSLSDPATCAAPSGPYSHVYVTISDVQASTSANAGDNDPSFVDLTPSLKSAPVQIDLLGQANNQCFLATLGSNTQLQAGSYQQIRFILLDNAAANGPGSNKCGAGAFNCVQLTADNSLHTLQLSSESKTGIKIPSGQIAGGQFAIAAGQTKDLNIDFNTCESIVIQGNGQFRLKPVLRAGEVSTTATSINGTVVDGLTGAPVTGGRVMVAVEQPSPGPNGSSVDRIVMETAADASGNFTFCPLPAGNYDVVVEAINGTGTIYAPTVITAVPVGSALGSTVKVYAGVGLNGTPASLTGQVTSSTGSAGVSVDLALSALQQLASNNNLYVTIPLVQQNTGAASLATAAGSSCATGTDCASYTLSVPAVNATVGAFGGTLSQNNTTPVNYTVDAQSFIAGSGNKPDCTVSDQFATAVQATPGATTTAQTIAFVGCS